jgi:hypothetical protein
MSSLRPGTYVKVSRLDRVRRWLGDDTNQFMLGAVTAALIVSWWIRRASERLVELEKRWPDGRVPLDDLVTVGELDRRLAEHAARHVAQPTEGGEPADAGE